VHLSVILPAHNPHAGRLARTLAGLAAQSLPPSSWETLLVDNASTPSLAESVLPALRPPNLRVLRENILGLTAARLCGLRAAQSDLCVFVDDDNVLSPDYLSAALSIFSSSPKLGAAGGPSRPEFEIAPPLWAVEFLPLLALRDFGPRVILADLERSADGRHWLHPRCAPIGAGLVFRRAAARAWFEEDAAQRLADRSGAHFTSGGDNDIVLTVLRAGWQVGYFPELALTHLIPASRLDPAYLARLNRGIQFSWMQVLSKHDANPWSPIPRWTVPLRKARAWFAHRGWSRPSGYIRWQGACGHFEGRATIAKVR
jgi:glycosyltransferase involved in cell wall biosynthesis